MEKSCYNQEFFRLKVVKLPSPWPSCPWPRKEGSLHWGACKKPGAFILKGSTLGKVGEIRKREARYIFLLMQSRVTSEEVKSKPLLVGEKDNVTLL